MGKLPWFPFFPGDWMKDPELRSVSMEARGLWMDMLCLMFESKKRGYLLLGSLQERYITVSPEMLARMTGAYEARVVTLLTELESSGVFSRDSDGVIFSRRMVKDQQLREKTSDRVKRFRNGDVTHHVTPSAVDVDEDDIAVAVGSKKTMMTQNENSAEVLEIYQAYPRRIGKRAALKAILAAISRLMAGEYKGEKFEAPRAISGLKDRTVLFSESVSGNKGVMTPHPATWFNRGSYLDDPEEWNLIDPGRTSERDQKNTVEANIGVWRPS